MVDIAAPILYFLVLFGVFEVGMFKQRRAYWHWPYATALYFGCVTMGALLLFSMQPASMVLASDAASIVTLLFMSAVLLYLASRGHFRYGDSPEGSKNARTESFRYVGAKSIDIVFQDVLAVIIYLAMLAHTGDPLLSAIFFGIYFFISHLLLLFILPVKFAAIFIAASLGASLAFSWILFSSVGVLYLFILHWAFYAVSYQYIRRIRMAHIS